MKRIHRGRQKIEIKKMSDQSNLHVTFSKRRFGVFKKASELCTLCGVDVAIIIFSPGKKVYSFGHKSVDSVVQHFVNGVAPTTLGPMDLIQSYRENTIRDLNAELMQVLEQLDMEKKRAQELSKMMKANQTQCWWQNPVSEMNNEQLGQLKLALEELQKNVTKQSQTVLFQNLNNAAHSFGHGQVMLPTAGLNESDIFCLSNADANGNVFGFDPNVVPPPAAAMPPSCNFEFGSNGFY